MNTPEEIAKYLLNRSITREFGYDIDDPKYEYHLDLFTRIVGRMNTHEESRIRKSYRLMVENYQCFKSLDTEAQDEVLYWMLVMTFGNNFDLEYHEDGVLVNAREE